MENAIDRQHIAGRSSRYVNRFLPEERERLKDGTFDYMGLTRDYYDLATAANLTSPVDFMNGGFMRIDAPDGSFDRAYAIESMPHAVSKADAFAEACRILKPGGLFASYDWCTTTGFDPSDADHASIKSEIMIGNALPDTSSARDIDRALEKAGFDILVNEDIAETAGTGVPWHKALGGAEMYARGLPQDTAWTPGHVEDDVAV